MLESTRKSIHYLVAATLLLAPAAPAAAGLFEKNGLRSAVVKIYATTLRPDYLLPWQSTRPTSGTGSGYIIAGKRILTNAHVVSDTRFLEVQKQGDPKRYKARVRFIAHDCDLAMLEVENPEFFTGTSSLRLASELPDLNDEVTVLGYPMGGVRLSITRGVVSRIDYSTYSHSGVDQHLVLQVDAAINPGNSGGPVLYGKRVVGLAFQGLSWAENIGYAIPLPVIKRFLEDVADGTYHGYAELGVGHLGLRNPALRADLGIPDGQQGVAVTYVDPFGCAHGRLRNGDVILAIDDHNVADDGTVEFDGNRVHYGELIERKQWGEDISLRLWRQGASPQAEGSAVQVRIPLTNPRDPFVYRRSYDTPVRYLVRGGLVFSPLSREYLQLRRRNGSANVNLLSYYFEYAKIDGHHERYDEFPVFTRRLPHAINAYAETFLNGVVTHVNDRPVRNLDDIGAAWEQPVDGFHVIRFAGLDDVLVMRAADARDAREELLDRYGVTRDAYLGEAP